MIFYKTVTCGNDFIHIDSAEYEAAVPVPTGAAAAVRENRGKGELARLLCQRNTGAGADGVIFYRTFPNTPEVEFEIFNQDGSEAELSGNGMAGCSALLFYLNKRHTRDPVILSTKVGLRKHSCLQQEKNSFRLSVEIGKADFQNRRFFPFIRENQWEYRHEEITFYPVSVGNPHAVVLLEKAVEEEQLEQIGKKLESAEIFPCKTNVELVFPIKPGPLDYETGENAGFFYYERGVGRTLSSSTGSAAIFAVLQALNLSKDILTIPLPRGSIKISGKNGIYIESSTKIVYKGVYIHT